MKSIATFRKSILIALGFLSLGLGILGIFLPLMPTTPFLLLAAWCFSKSSEKFHRMLLTNRFVGKYLSDYQAGKGIPLRVKIVTIAVLWASCSLSVWMLRARLPYSALLLIIPILVTLHLLRTPTKAPP